MRVESNARCSVQSLLQWNEMVMQDWEKERKGETTRHLLGAVSLNIWLVILCAPAAFRNRFSLEHDPCSPSGPRCATKKLLAPPAGASICR